MHRYVAIHPEIAAALKSGRPVVALESTVMVHGLPKPQGLETARALEAKVRQEGAVPATVAVVDGRLRVGLDDDDLVHLSEEGGRKVSRRDLPLVLAAGANGATTVAATLIAARLAGISVFATGGIGGVHRGAETTLDISADLEELACSNVAVVCAGAKAILDLPKTLEYLETRGVPVVGFGTDRFPAFYTAAVDLPVDARCDSPDEVARIMQAKWELGLDGAIVVANPIPEEAALDAAAVEEAIRAAVADAGAKGIQGKALTPFLLNRMEALTEGASLTANKALLINNAALAARIAVAHSRLRSDLLLPQRPPPPKLRA